VKYCALSRAHTHKLINGAAHRDYFLEFYILPHTFLLRHRFGHFCCHRAKDEPLVALPCCLPAFLYDLVRIEIGANVVAIKVKLQNQLLT
jgi:hypothetical protein